jgi:hypothetical protein
MWPVVALMVGCPSELSSRACRMIESGAVPQLGVSYPSSQDTLALGPASVLNLLPPTSLCFPTAGRFTW